MGRIGLVVSDLVLSFMWIWAGVLVNILVHGVLGFSRSDPTGEIVRYLFSIISMFIFAFLQQITKGGLYNPLTALASGVSGGFSSFIFSVFVRIPVEVCFVDFSTKTKIDYSLGRNLRIFNSMMILNSSLYR